MFDFHEKRKIRGWLFSKFTILVLVVCLGFLSVSVFERFMTLRDITEKRAAKEAERADLEQRAAALESDVGYLKQKRGVEEELRSRFDLAKEGERAVIIVNNPAGEAPQESAPSTSPDTVEVPWWAFLKFW